MPPLISKIGATLPVSFKEFSKKPLTAIMYLLFIAVSFLYLRVEKSYRTLDEERKTSIRECLDETKKLRTEVGFYNEQARRSDSALADVRATLKVIKEVSKIKLNESAN